MAPGLIGVVPDVREISVEGESGLQIYVPATQHLPEVPELVVRTELPAAVLASRVMSSLRAMNPGQPGTEFRPMQQIVDHTTTWIARAGADSLAFPVNFSKKIRMIDKTKQEMLVAVEAAESKKAEGLVILEMDQTAGAFTDYFIICSGSSSRQIQSISDEIELQVKRQTGTYAHQVEGYREGEWVLVDYMDFIVHIFSEERRAFYGLERLWKSARALTLEEFKATPTAQAIAEPAELPAKKSPAVTKARPVKALALSTSAKSKKATEKKKPASTNSKSKTGAKTKTKSKAKTKTKTRAKTSATASGRSLKKVATKSSKKL